MAQNININNNHKFDIYFDDNEGSNNKGFAESYEFCKNYIDTYNGTSESYFGDYKGGTVSIYDIDAEEYVYSEEVK